MKMRTALLVAVASLLVMVALYIGSPFWAASRIEKAVVAKDTDTLGQLIDADAVATDLRGRMDAEIIKNGGYPEGLAGVMAPAIVDRMVNAAVSPYGMMELLKGRPPLAAPGYDEPEITYRWGYVSPNRFRIRTFNGTTQADGPSFLMKRDNLFQWKIAKVEPAETPAA